MQAWWSLYRELQGKAPKLPCHLLCSVPDPGWKSKHCLGRKGKRMWQSIYWIVKLIMVKAISSMEFLLHFYYISGRKEKTRHFWVFIVISQWTFSNLSCLCNGSDATAGSSMACFTVVDDMADVEGSLQYQDCCFIFLPLLQAIMGENHCNDKGFIKGPLVMLLTVKCFRIGCFKIRTF